MAALSKGDILDLSNAVKVLFAAEFNEFRALVGEAMNFDIAVAAAGAHVATTVDAARKFVGASTERSRELAHEALVASVGLAKGSVSRLDADAAVPSERAHVIQLVDCAVAAETSLRQGAVDSIS